MNNTISKRLQEIFTNYKKTLEELGNNCILIYRMGDFYEVFFDDAEKVAEVLGLKVGARGGVKMCGFPKLSYDMSVAKLVRHGLPVAICENV